MKSERSIETSMDIRRRFELRISRGLRFSVGDHIRHRKHTAIVIGELFTDA